MQHPQVRQDSLVASVRTWLHVSKAANIFNCRS